ncbi:MAG TPA: FliG C-terminal domain-containing protein [Pirellulaceae bacterium]|nr:FliG C-terminal domain-containing protein [Pirellulaceae bacterium]
MTRTDSIRKAAILVSLLEARDADALLEPMGDELAAQVRHAVMELDDVTAAEQEEVLAEFFGRSEAVAQDDGGVETEWSAIAAASERSTSPASPLPAAPLPTFDFLASVPPAAIADVLAAEQPQTIAVIVAHLRPEIAGRVLEHLPPAVATEALARMARLIMPVPEILSDLECELRRRLAPFVHGAAHSSASLAGIQAILASLPGQSRWQWLDRLAQHDRQLASRLDAAGAFSSAGTDDGQVLAFKYRLESSLHEQPLAGRPAASPSPPLVEFEDLMLLSDRDLACFAAAAREQLLALALIDADVRLTQRIVAVLPAREAAQLKSRLSHPGPLRLKEIDEAQRQLADLARDLASQGEISLPRSRHFAAAA